MSLLLFAVQAPFRLPDFLLFGRDGSVLRISLCGESPEPMHGFRLLLPHKMAGLGFILVSSVHLGLEHDLAWVRLFAPTSRKCALCS